MRRARKKRRLHRFRSWYSYKIGLRKTKKKDWLPGQNAQLKQAWLQQWLQLEAMGKSAVSDEDSWVGLEAGEGEGGELINTTRVAR